MLLFVVFFTSANNTQNLLLISLWLDFSLPCLKHYTGNEQNMQDFYLLFLGIQLAVKTRTRLVYTVLATAAPLYTACLHYTAFQNMTKYHIELY